MSWDIVVRTKGTNNQKKHVVQKGRGEGQSCHKEERSGVKERVSRLSCLCGSVKIKKYMGTPAICPLIVMSPKHVLMPYHIHALCGRRAPPERTRLAVEGLGCKLTIDAHRLRRMRTCPGGKERVSCRQFELSSSGCQPECRARKRGE
jgi:hypothetical protein